MQTLFPQRSVPRSRPPNPYHKHMKDISSLNPERILVCQLRQIGDVLLATPSIRLLKERFPNAEIEVFTEKKCAPVLENNPHISKVRALDKDEVASPLKALGYYARVGRGKDLIIDFQQLPRTRWVAMLSGAPVRLTFTPPWYNKFVYTHYRRNDDGYAAKCKASILKLLGIEWDRHPPEIFLSDEEKAFADDFLKRIGATEGVVTVDPSHRRKTRKWPEEHFAGLIRGIREEHPGLKFVLLYGPGEVDVCRKVADLAGEGAVIPEDMLSLRQMAAVQQRALLHMGNCSAPRHMAVAVGTPSLVVHGATGFAWRFPSEDHVGVIKKLPCQPCNENECSHISCLKELTPAECLPQALKLVRNSLDAQAEQTDG